MSRGARGGTQGAMSRYTLPFLAVAVSIAPAVAQSPEAALDDLIVADRGFAAASAGTYCCSRTRVLAASGP